MTFVEMMVAMSVFSLVVIAMLYTHMFGLYQDELAESKLGASDNSRKGFNQLMHDIRSAKVWRVGKCSVTSGGVCSGLTLIATNQFQQGNALELNL